MSAIKRIILTGGGSGGHITPILAVAAELKRVKPGIELIYIGQTGDKLGDLPAKNPNIDHVYTVRAGKFRRYYGEGFRQLLDIPTTLKNIRDVFYVLVGLWQSRRLLKKLQPDALFVKGGFVGVPVGLAAASLHIPYLTHDSDIIPGLANRIIGRWASLHAVALPAELYDYPGPKTVTTGIPLQSSIVPVNADLKARYRKEINVPMHARMLFIIGGGLGAQRLNDAAIESVPHLLAQFPDLYVAHGTGRANQENVKKAYKTLPLESQERVKAYGYLEDMYRYAGSADLIITRAGATNLAEFALQGKACIVVPSAVLTGGHQTKNAAYLEEQGAAVVISEADLRHDPNRVAKQVSELLKDPQRIKKLGQGLSEFAKPEATEELAKLILALK